MTTAKPHWKLIDRSIKPPRRHRLGGTVWWLLCICSLFAGLFLTGCGRPEKKADLVIINGEDPETLDPALATGLEDLRVIMALFEGLTRYDPITARAVPGLADRWTISPDGRVYTFHIRANAVWSTGQPITAEDFVYSWRRVLDPATAADYAGQLFYVKNGRAYNSGALKDPSQLGFHALNDHTFQVELAHPTPFFLELCAFQTLAVVPRQVIAKMGDDWLRAKPLPVSGPYELITWRLNDKIRLRKNPRYWDAAHTHCRIVDLLPIDSPNTAFNLYETGQADIIWDKTLVPPDILDVLKSRPDYHSFPYLGTYFLRFNVTKRPLNDPRVRQALALAIDKKRIVERITRGGELVASHLVPPGIAHYRPPKGLGYDPARARRLLAAAGYPGGRGFPTLQYLFDAPAGGAADIHEKIAVELQEMWKKQLGIQVDLRQMEKKVYLAAQNSLNYDISRSSWIGDYDDPNTFLDLFRGDSGNNRTGWKNNRYDALMEEANRQTDPDRRAALLRQAETILVRQQVPIVPLYFYIGFNLYDPAHIAGIYPNILDIHPIRAIRLRRGRRLVHAP